MSYKTIMVSVDETDASKARLELGQALAERWNGKLVAVAFALAEVPIVFADAYSAAMFETASSAAREDAEGAVAAAKAALAAARCDWEVRVATGVSAATAEVAAQEALYADLCVMAAPSAAGDDTGRATRLLEGVLFGGAAPVLATPAGVDPGGKIGDRIAVAWDARREAARAAHEAKPFFAEASSIDTLVVSHFWGSEPYGPVPGAAFTHWLSRHGVAPELRELEGSDVAQTILNDLAERKRDLLVMGAYGHSRLREALFGGVTESLLKRSPVPLLMAH